MEIRKINPKYINDILKLDVRFTSPWKKETYFKRLDENPELAYGSFKNDKLVGFILGRRLSSGNIKISRLVVHKDFEGRGIGGKLVDTLTNKPDTADKMISIVREDNKRSINLHKHRGFDIIPKDFTYKNGTKGIRFKKRL